METVLLVVCVVVFWITWNMIKYNKKIKENERSNNTVTPIINQERYNLKGDKKIPKAKAQNKRKPGRPKKKNAKPKVKINERQDKKKV